MFHLTKSKFGSFEELRFEHADQKHSFSLIPQKGAMLLDVQIKGDSLLDGYQTEADLLENKRYKSNILAPFPNRLAKGVFEFEEKNYQLPINDPTTPNALHGLVYDKAFSVFATALEAETCSVVLSYTHISNALFPFEFDLFLEYELSLKEGFILRYLLKNRSKTNMPAAFGWHPYFQLGGLVDEIALQLPKVEKIEVNQHLLPTGKKSDFNDFKQLKKIGKRALDSCFEIKETASIVSLLLQKGKKQIRFWQKTGEKQLNYVQLYIPPDRKSIAIEPMTCSIDAFNNKEGLIVLAPEESMQSTCGFSYTT